MKNCRTCKHAKWQTTPSGRRRFGNRAECTAPIEIPLANLPASAWEALCILERVRTVASYDNEPLECNLWEKRDKS